MGSAFADNVQAPHSAQLLDANFCFFAGRPSAELVRHTAGKKEFLMIPPDTAWAGLIEQMWGSSTKRMVRCAFQPDKDAFQPEKLTELLVLPREAYRLVPIDKTIYSMTLQEKWSADLCGNFADEADYQKRGLGFAVLYRGKLAAGASSYTVYRGGIEIQVDTKEAFRRRGLAAACAAQLILTCLERGLYPVWDAAGRPSARLAQKLGYRFAGADPAYAVLAASPTG